MRGPDDMPVLMSVPSDALVLARLELGKDSITFELRHPSYGVILEAGFIDRSHYYCLAETGYTTDAAPNGSTFLFLVEAPNGKRYRWYVHTENPTETFIQINAHMKAKVTLKPDAAVILYVVQQAAFSLGQAA